MTSVLNSSGSLEYSYKYDSSNTRLLKRDLEENVVTFYPSDNYEESYDKNPANSTLGIPATLETTIDRHVFFAGLRIATRETVLTVATSVPSSNVTSS